MPEGVIDMGDMEAIFSVTDALGIHRESVRVDLGKEDPGSIEKADGGIIEITVPESASIQEFSQKLDVQLKALGYTTQEGAVVRADEFDVAEEEEDSWP